MVRKKLPYNYPFLIITHTTYFFYPRVTLDIFDNLLKSGNTFACIFEIFNRVTEQVCTRWFIYVINMFFYDYYKLQPYNYIPQTPDDLSPSSVVQASE